MLHAFVLPGNKKKRLLYFGYPKRNDFFKRGYFRFWKRLGTKKRNESKRNGNVPEPSEILGTKKLFPLSLPRGTKMPAKDFSYVHSLP